MLEDTFRFNKYNCIDDLFGLYIHIPFCNSLCPYCAFYSQTDISLMDIYIDTILYYIKECSSIKFDTIYIGGGTPTALSVSNLKRLLDGIDFYLNLSSLKEFTIEANPESLTPYTMTVLNESSVNRISIGCQSVNDDVLKLMGRIHDSTDVFKACDLVKKYPKFSLSVDMIYDIPEVDPSIIYNGIKDILKVLPSHISTYSYMPDTGFLTLTPSDDESQMVKITSILGDAGYSQYEISNYSLPGYKSLHNIKYWEMGSYIGIGASAHGMANFSDSGKIGRVRSSFISDIKPFIERSSSYDDVITIFDGDVYKENVLFGLRLLDGVDISHIPLNAIFSDKIDRLISEGILEFSYSLGNKRLKATDKGIYLLDSIMSFLY